MRRDLFDPVVVYIVIELTDFSDHREFTTASSNNPFMQVVYL